MGPLEFVVLGAPHTAATTLSELLRQHPDLSPPAESAGHLTDMVSLRSTAREMAERVVARVHAGGVIALLRDPVARAASHHDANVRLGIERRSLATALEHGLHPAALRAARTPAAGAPAPTDGARAAATATYIAWGEYGRILRPYRTLIAPERVLILFEEDLVRDPTGTLRRALTFLGADGGFVPAIAEAAVGSREGDDAVAGAARAGALAELPPALRDRLARHFGTDGARLRSDWGADAPWVRPTPPPRMPPAPAQPDTSIIVLVHETAGEAELALESIARHTGGGYEVLLVDNGSSDAVASVLRDLAARLGARLIRHDDNLVFSVAMNRATEAARGREILLLNSDVVVTPNWLATLRAALYSAPDVAAVGPRSNYMRLAQGGVWLDDSSWHGIERFGRRFNFPDPARRFEIDWLSGFALLIRRGVWEELGGLDESLPWYGLEDLDFGQRIWRAGHRTLCAGDVFVFHAGHRTFSSLGVNRTATRLGRSEAAAPTGSGAAARLVREGGLVFELRDGVALHAETYHVVRLIREGRPVEEVPEGTLADAPVGPPLALSRVRETDEVWLLHGSERRRVEGDGQRIRRLMGVSMAEPGELDRWSVGAPVRVENAIPPIPEIPPQLPSNPATIDPRGLLSAVAVSARIREALASERPLALIQAGAAVARLLNDGMWRADPPDPDALGIAAVTPAARALVREALRNADVLALHTRRDVPDAAPLLEQLLFHFEIYPRGRCAVSAVAELLGVNRSTALIGTTVPPVIAALTGRPVAVVAAAPGRAVAAEFMQAAHAGTDLEIATVIGLDDIDDVDRVLASLAMLRSEYDAVLVDALAGGKVLCARLARELGVVALDLGPALGRWLKEALSRRR